MSKHPPLIPTYRSTALSQLPTPTSTPEPTFNHARHTTYWLRCARTYLPEAYTSGDSSRMLFAYFIVSALDLLGLLDSGELDQEDGPAKTKKVTAQERHTWIDWIYHCQREDGGFKGFTGAIVGKSDGEWDPANLPATFFALCSLLMLGDGLERVRRQKCLEWVRRMQRRDGSFGETLGKDGEVEGGRDLRFCCCAAGIRKILMGGARGPKGDLDFDVQEMLGYIESSQGYEGGFGEGPFAEPHSGLTYCAVGALSFLGRIPEDIGNLVEGTGIDLAGCMRWMLQRQTTYIEEEDIADGDTEEGLECEQESELSPIDGSLELADLRYAGFNGRTNKVADTCYAFWNVGALAILDQGTLVDSTSLRRYLLGKVQHMVGGFGKGVGEPPDLLHAYLGLATMSLLGEKGLKTIEPTLCISRGAAARIEQISWREDGA